MKGKPAKDFKGNSVRKPAVLTARATGEILNKIYHLHSSQPSNFKHRYLLTDEEGFYAYYLVEVRLMVMNVIVN